LILRWIFFIKGIARESIFEVNDHRSMNNFFLKYWITLSSVIRFLVILLQQENENRSTTGNEEQISEIISSGNSSSMLLLPSIFEAEITKTFGKILSFWRTEDYVLT
jgi:hypothetical protein